jgi:hypothetical protein
VNFAARLVAVRPTMRKLLAPLLLALLSAPAAAQNFPQNLPANTVLGRLAIGPGPAQAIPLTTLQASLLSGSNCGNNAVGCFSIIQNLAAPPDNTGWLQSFIQFGTTFSLAGSGVSGSANQFGVDTQILISSTGSAASYEKAATYTICQTQDPSTVSINRLCVGSDVRGIIASGNTLGSVYAALDTAQIVSGGGADGSLAGHVIQILNGGSNQAAVNTTTSKYGLEIVSAGSSPATAAMYVFANGNTFHKGIVIQPSALVGLGTDANASAFELVGLWTLRPNGRVEQVTTDVTPYSMKTTAGGAVSIALINNATVPSTSDTFLFNTFLNDATSVQYVAGQFGFFETANGHNAANTQFSISTARNSSVNQVALVNHQGHWNYLNPGAGPTISGGCNGAGSSITGSDYSGTINGQTVAATSCSVNFANAFTSAPNCVFTGGTAAIVQAVTNTAGFTVTFVSTSSQKITYICPGV